MMPTYEFICNHCGENFTVYTSITRRKESTCPLCFSTDLRPVFRSPFGFLKKGESCGSPPRGGFT